MEQAASGRRAWRPRVLGSKEETSGKDGVGFDQEGGQGIVRVMVVLCDSMFGCGLHRCFATVKI